jgi:hypothetical protein
MSAARPGDSSRSSQAALPWRIRTAAITGLECVQADASIEARRWQPAEIGLLRAAQFVDTPPF